MYFMIGQAVVTSHESKDDNKKCNNSNHHCATVGQPVLNEE